MKTAVIAQARLGSTRLPGKVMKGIMGRPMLEHFIDRLKRVRNVDEIIIATPAGESEKKIWELAERLGVTVFNGFNGSEDDVLGRYYEAARFNSVDVIVRVTSDCPVIAPEIIEKMVARFLDSDNSVDYLSNTLETGGFKRTFPRGLDTEVFSFAALSRADKEAKAKSEREHVTPYIYLHPELFNLSGFENDIDCSHHRWTVDTTDDLELIRRIYEALYQDGGFFSFEDILGLFEQRPELVGINKAIKQKKLSDE